MYIWIQRRRKKIFSVVLFRCSMYIVLLLIYKKRHVGEKIIKVEKLKTLIFGGHFVQQLGVTIITYANRFRWGGQDQLIVTARIAEYATTVSAMVLKIKQKKWDSLGTVFKHCALYTAVVSPKLLFTALPGVSCQYFHCRWSTLRSLSDY